MSNVAYDQQWSEAVNDLMEQVTIENMPAEKNEKNQIVGNSWNYDEWFQHNAQLYINYISVFKKIEDCYDQVIQPQKRIALKPLLECTLARICEIKAQLITFNKRPRSDLIHLDDLLMDLKKDPDVLEVPIPRFFKVDDRIPVKIVIPEVLEKKKEDEEEEKKKKKKKKVEPEEKKPLIPLCKKNQLMKHFLTQAYETDEPVEEEEITQPFFIDISLIDAIRLLQKSEMGRQGRQRILKAKNAYLKFSKEYEQKKLITEGHQQDISETEKERRACVYIQRRLRGILCRKNLEKMRQEELMFLGMARKKLTKEEEQKSAIEKEKRNREERRLKQDLYQAEYDTAIIDAKAEIQVNEEFEIKDKMLDERRDWRLKYQELHEGKLPPDVSEFYNKDKVGLPPTEEEKEKMRLEAEEAKKKAKKKPAKKEGKKGKKKKEEKEDPTKHVIWTGPSALINKFQEYAQEYTNVWEKKDEAQNFDQKFDMNMIKQLVRPEVEEMMKVEVDKIIELEIQNIQFMLSSKKKKKKKKAKKKAKKSKKGKRKPLPGEKAISKLAPDQLLAELVEAGIAKKLAPASMKDFIGDYNLLGTIMDKPMELAPDPSMAQLRNLVTENCILGLGSLYLRERITPPKSVLFYGSSGSGKTFMTRVVCHETASMVLDISPGVIEGKYSEKKGEDKMIAMVMHVAEEYQPSVVLIDECEMVFAKKKKKKKKGKGEGSAKKNTATRIKKTLAKYKKLFVKPEMKILFIGCTSVTDEMSTADAKNFFEKQFYFPYPDYTNRRMMWKKMIENNGGIIHNNFPLSTLSFISEGYTCGSIIKACESIFSKHRIETQEIRPLTITEFIGPLSLAHCTLKQEFDSFKSFYDIVSGDKERREKILKEKEEAEEEKKGKKKGGGKKKK